MVSEKSKHTGKRLKHFIGDGIGASACEGFAEANFNAFSTFLSASTGKLSILSALQNLLGCWLQLWSEKLVRILGSRKKLVLICVSLQASTLAAMLPSILFGISIYYFMGLVLLFSALGGLSGPVWNSWISELLPTRRRGFCFGIRNQRTYPTHFLSLIAGGFFLQKLQFSPIGTQATQFAFFTAFTLGMISKLISLRHLCLQPETNFKLPEKCLGPIELIHASYRDSRMRRAALFFGTMGFAINISAPFQVPYMLNTMHVSYLHLSFVSAAYIGARFFTAPTIGKLIDSLGSRHLLLFSTLLMPWISLGWAISPTYSCILITQFFAGLVWTTFDLCAFTYLSETTKSEKRQRIFSLKHISWYLGSSSGAILGGILESSFLNPHLVFWASSFFRGIAAIFIFKMMGRIWIRKEEPAISEELPTVRDVA